MIQSLSPEFYTAKIHINELNLPVTTIKYELPEASKVNLIVYGILGSEIAKIISEEKPAGEYEVEFKGTALPSGIYF